MARPWSLTLIRRAALAGSIAILMISSVDAMTLRRGSFSEPRSLDPHKVTGNTGSIIVYDMFEGLLTTNPGGSIVGGLAQDWSISDDGLTYTFRLKPDLKWSDGTALKSADVVYSYRRLVDPETASPLVTVAGPIANARAVVRGAAPTTALGVSALDEQTIEIKLARPTPYYPQMLLAFANSIVPRHAIEAHDQAWTKPENIVTSGAFVLKEWLSNTYVKVARNDYYYASAEIAIDEVIYYPIENGATSLKRYRAGELDVTLNFPPSQIAWLRENYAADLHIFPTLALGYILVNHKMPPFNNVRIRRALSIALDRDIVVERLLNDGSKAAYNLVPSAMPGYGENPASFKDIGIEQRVAEAKELMERAGYTPEKPLKLSFKVGTSEESKRLSVAYQGFWRRVGIDVEIQEFDTSSLVRAARTGDFDLMRYSYFAPYADPMSFLNLLRSDSSTNRSGYFNPAFNALINKANELSDAGERLERLKEAEHLAMEDVAIIPTVFKPQRHLVSARVKGWRDNPRNIYFARYLNVIDESN